MFKRFFSAGDGANVEVEEPQVEERVLPVIPQIRTIADLDTAIRVFGDSARGLVALREAKDSEIKAVEAKYHADIVADTKLVEQLYDDIEAFLKENPQIRNGDNRMDLTYGILKWRKTPPTVVLKVSEEEAVQQLKAHKLWHLVRTGKESVDRNQVKSHASLVKDLDFIGVASGEKLEIIAY